MLAVAAAFVLQFQVVNCAEKTSAETVIEQETQIDVLQSSYAQPADATKSGRKKVHSVRRQLWRWLDTRAYGGQLDDQNQKCAWK